MIIDGHAHILDTDYGDAKALLEQYKVAGVDKGILVPGGMLDVRKMTKYINGEEQPDVSQVPNFLVENAIAEYPDRFYGFYCVNPHKGKPVLDELKTAMQKGFCGLKLAPMVHQFSLSAPIIMELAELCGILDIPFYTHTVYSPAASTKKMNQLVKKFPKTNFILGHMGFGPSDVEAVQFALESDNLYLESSQGSHVILKEAVEKLGSTKLIFGSEFPMYHPSVSLQSIYALNCSSNELDNILCNNMMNLIKK